MDMPKRSKQQQVEDLSINALKNVLPREWVYREKDKDYGIDGEVEIFDKDDKATGMVFLVQLKATDSEEETMQKKVVLKVASINYYQSLELPVLIVRYSEEAKQLYFRWTHELDRNKFHDQKTFSFRMKESEKWCGKTPEYLVGTLRKYSDFRDKSNVLPIKTYLDFTFSEICSMDPKRVKSSFRERLDQKSNLIQTTTEKDEAEAKIELTNDRLSIYFVGIPGCHFGHMDKISYEGIDDLLDDVFIAFAMALIHLNKPADALMILESFASNSTILKSPKIALSFIAEYMKQGDIEKANKLWMDIPSKAKDDNVSMEFHMMLSIMSLASGYDLFSMQEEFLLGEIEKYIGGAEAEKLSASYYNYANHLRYNDHLKESIIYYRKALDTSGHFSQSDLIFKEMAGTLFQLGRFRISAKLYQHGLSFKEDARGVSLYADALMTKGDYLLAYENFEKYFELCETHEPIWTLKSLVLEYVVKVLKIKSQHRSYYQAMKTQTIKDLGIRHISRDELLSILDIDALSPLVWFNLAADYSKAKEYDIATVGYLMSALINKNDNEAWKRAFETALLSSRADIALLIVHAGFKESGEEFLRGIYDFIDNRMKFPDADFRKHFEESIERTIEEIGQKKAQKEIVFNGESFLI